MKLNKLTLNHLSFVIFRKIQPFIDNTFSKKKVRLGIEILLINISKFLIIALVASILDVLFEALITGSCIAFLRITLGGKHASSSFKCTLFSLILLLDCIFLSKLILVNNTTLILCYPILIYLVYKFAPADTIKNPIKDENRRYNLKISSVRKSILLALISLIIPIPILKSTIFFSLILVIIFILPIDINFLRRRKQNVIKFN